MTHLTPNTKILADFESKINTICRWGTISGQEENKKDADIAKKGLLRRALNIHQINSLKTQ